MADLENDPAMPKRPPIAALRAIEQIKAYRNWTAVEMYRAIRAALQERDEYQQAPGMLGSGDPPVQG